MKNRKELHKIEDGLAFKIGSPYCLFEGEQRKMAGKKSDKKETPCIIDGEIYVPVKILNEFIGREIVDSSIREIGGNDKNRVLPLTRVEKLTGLFVYSDYMGLVLCTREKLDVSIDKDLSLLLDIMKRFIFQNPTPCEVFEDAEKNTNNFTHPFLMVNENRFDYFRRVYYAKDGDVDFDLSLKKMLNTYINGGISTYKRIAQPRITDSGDEDYSLYVGMKQEEIPTHPHKTEDGYDIGGRINIDTGTVKNVAFAYQITGDEKYAKLCYDYLLAYGNYRHWGSGHFLNCAGGTAGFAVVLDWIYNGILEIYKTDKHYDIHILEDILYEKGVKMGYLSVTGKKNPHHRLAGDAGFYYTERRNNWNEVCTCGMTMGSLMLLERQEYRLESASLISIGLRTVAENGLDEYAPDGSYEESASYWCYGTNYLWNFLAVLKAGFGKDYGFYNLWGLDKTCYFATHIESGDCRAFSYNDGNPVNMNTSWFNFVSSAFGDENLRRLRAKQIEGDKKLELPDILFYEKNDGQSVALPLFYKMEGMDGYTARNSWEKGSIFVGLLGGGNGVSHGQVDSGTFVYHNKGKIWYYDLGADYYNVYNYFGPPVYYRRNAEGNNDICLVSRQKEIPFGQSVEGKGKLIKCDGDEKHSFAVIDNGNVYGEYAKVALRGLRIDGDVTVLADEIEWKEEESAYWFAHISKEEVSSVELSKDKRVAFSRSVGNDGKEYILRSSIVSPDSDIHFEISDCYDFKLDATYRKGQSEKLGGQPEFERDSFSRLQIFFDKKKKIQLAVVIELVKDVEEKTTEYKFKNILDWN